MASEALLKIMSVALCTLCISCIVKRSEGDIESYRSSRPDVDIARLEKKIHAQINEERKKKGLTVLLWDEGLHTVARKHSDDMERRNFFSHDDPEGRSFYDRYQAAGYECKIRTGTTTYMGAENISQDNLYSSTLYRNGETFFEWKTEDEIAASVVKRWMRSRGHRENILTPYFERQGIGVSLSRDGKVYVTENFC
jgi:uncharacterized protein YkwD